MKERIFLQDEDLIVVFKPHNESMSDCNSKVKEYVKKDVRQIYDLETLSSGIVVFALNDKVYELLNKAYKQNEFEFKFYAVTVGNAKNESGTYNAYVTRDKKSGRLIHIPQLNVGAENFGFVYHLLQKIQQIQLVKIEVNQILPETIRFAMSDLNMPIFGDKLYEGDILAKNTNLSLSLVDLRFKHPNQDKYLNFRAMLPETKPWNYFDLNKIFKL